MNFTINSGWELITMLTNAGEYLKTVGGQVVIILGICILIYGAVQVVSAIWGRQGGGGAWLKALLAFVVGGAFMIGGWQIITNISQGGNDTINQLGGGMIEQLGMLLTILK